MDEDRAHSVTRTALSGHRSNSPKSSHSTRSSRSVKSILSTESTPLLSRDTYQRNHSDQGLDAEATSSVPASLRSVTDRPRNQPAKSRRWPTILSLAILSVALALILIAGFFAPAIVQEYAMQAAVFEPTNLSIDSFTATGVQAKVQGRFMMDASRVSNRAVRDLGRAATWIARKVESGESQVKVYLPEYGNVFLGMATIPRIVVDIRNGHATSINFLSDLRAGDIDGIRRIANDWLDDRLGQLRIEGRAEIPLKSGLFPLGTQSISESLSFEGHDLPAMPRYNITKVGFQEVFLPHQQKGMAVDVFLTLFNPYPVKFTVPPLGFDILVPSCAPRDPYIMLAVASTGEIDVVPRELIGVSVGGIIHHLSDVLVTACPESLSSPLDMLLGNYIHGEETTVYVRGSKTSSLGAPTWVTELASEVTVPVPFPGHTFDNLVKNFSLAKVHIGLPDPLAEPHTPESQPRISAMVKALVTLPEQMRFPINVSNVRADAEVFYHDKKLGNLDLSRWQKANSTCLRTEDGEFPQVAVESIVDDAPLEVTDAEIFSEIVHALVFGTTAVLLRIEADVDVEVETVMGTFVVRRIPTQGKIPLKPLSETGFGAFAPKIGSIEIVNTSPKSLLLHARVNITNPTKYSASLPYVNIHIFNNGTLLGQASAREVSIIPGENDNIPIEALWDPSSSGIKGQEIGRELLSQYISGYNTTLTLRTHNGTIPSQPALGEALSALAIEILTPKLSIPGTPSPGGDDNKGPSYIKDATMHILSSSTDFVLVSPLPHATLYVTHVNATAFYNHTDPVGAILYDLPFAVPPGTTRTPRLPVEWGLDSVGYEALKSALGGTLRLDARAVVGIKIGKWGQEIWFEGGGIGANIRL